MALNLSGYSFDNFRPDRLRSREARLLCEGCQSVQCYEIKKRIGGLLPFSFKVLPLTLSGKVYNGICLACHPDRDPERSVHASAVTQIQSNLNTSNTVEDAFVGIGGNEAAPDLSLPAAAMKPSEPARQTENPSPHRETVEAQHDQDPVSREPEGILDTLFHEEKAEEQEAEQVMFPSREPEGILDTLFHEEKAEEQAADYVTDEMLTAYRQPNIRGSARSKSSQESSEVPDALERIIQAQNAVGELDPIKGEKYTFETNKMTIRWTNRC